MTLKLVIFDVDGTLVDSQAQIHSAMEGAFASVDRIAPSRESVRAIIGLSLPHAVANLAPDAPVAEQSQIVEAYKSNYVRQRSTGGGEAASPLFPGALSALETLASRDDVILGVATGKSRRGLDHLLEVYDLGRHFMTTQVADDHPSKPHPSMVESALSETGAMASDTVILGDTSFDMEMGVAAGVTSVGATWGYHPAEALKTAGATYLLAGFSDLLPCLETIWSQG